MWFHIKYFIDCLTFKREGMAWLLNLFKKNSRMISNSEITESKRKWDAFYAFVNGRQCWNERNVDEALTHFDKAIELGFIEYFKYSSADLTKLYDLRARCLQGLGYQYEAICDFDKAISYSPNDCDIYFSRSISKGKILDYSGKVDDIERAIQLSKESTKLNEEYDDEAKKMGYQNVAELLHFHLDIARIRFEDDLHYKKMLDEAPPEKKADIQKLIDKRNSIFFKGVKRR